MKSISKSKRCRVAVDDRLVFPETEFAECLWRPPLLQTPAGLSHMLMQSAVCCRSMLEAHLISLICDVLCLCPPACDQEINLSKIFGKVGFSFEIAPGWEGKVCSGTFLCEDAAVMLCGSLLPPEGA